MGAIHTAVPQGSSSNLRFELQGNAAKDRQSSEERQRTNNARTKAILKSDLLPVSCFLPATTQRKEQRSKSKETAALPFIMIVLDNQRRISMMILLPAYRKEHDPTSLLLADPKAHDPALLAALASNLPMHTNGQSNAQTNKQHKHHSSLYNSKCPTTFDITAKKSNINTFYMNNSVTAVVWCVRRSG